MTIPVQAWTQLAPEAKRARIHAAARELFARQGFDAPMPALATALGVGVGSLYRSVPSKHELITSLVLERLREVEQEVRGALASDARAAEALWAVLWKLAEQQSSDDLMGRAIELVGGEARVRRARARATVAFDELIDRARGEGSVRADASGRDVHLLFAATRAARTVDPAGWRRVLELFIESLRAGDREAR
jgi:AcrR family transcriptional regulator